jgi:hypothetical protein
MHEVTFTGPDYDADNALVFALINSITIDTEAHGWVLPFEAAQDGRGAALALLHQFEGDAQVNQRYHQAEHDLSVIHYKGNEAVYSFTKYTAKLMEIFQRFKDAGLEKQPAEKVQLLIKKMQVDHDPTLLNIKLDAGRRYRDNYEDCVAFIAAKITQHKQQESKPGSRGRRISSTGSNKRFRRGTGGGRDGRGGRGGRGRGNGRDTPMVINGVDIRDATRSFTQDEMNKLGSFGQAIMYDRRREMNAGRGGHGRGRGGRNVSAVTWADQQQQQDEQDPEAEPAPSGRGNNGQAFGRAGGGRGRGNRRG